MIVEFPYLPFATTGPFFIQYNILGAAAVTVTGRGGGGRRGRWPSFEAGDWHMKRAGGYPLVIYKIVIKLYLL